MKKAVVILGPTASGKTNTAVELSKMINGEVISADSMQVYKLMNIGTAKPTLDEMGNIPHHLIDIIYPDDEFSVASFKRRASELMKNIAIRNRVPIIAGGTGLYIQSLVNNIDYTEMCPNQEIREKYINIAQREGNVYLHNMLAKIDYEASEAIHPNNVRRVIRALEIFDQTGQTKSAIDKLSINRNNETEYIICGLQCDRNSLYKKIDSRVDIMLSDGLMDEVKNLLNMGYIKSLTSMQGLGYKEIVWHIKGLTTYNESINLIKRNTRRYAKRQMTWFNRMDNIKWFEVKDGNNIQLTVEKIYKYIASIGIF